MISYPKLLTFTQSFYSKATADVWIGFQFRNITNFETHIPRIADFWYMRLGNRPHDPSHLPFTFIEVHIPLKLKMAQINRWVVLFQETVKEMQNQFPEDNWNQLIDEMIKAKSILLRGLSASDCQS